MRTIIKSLIVASALVAGGSAFASDGNDNTFNETTAQSQLIFAAQPANRFASERPVAASRLPSQAAISQGFAPVNTQDSMIGSNK
jgi:hypothetical protein